MKVCMVINFERESVFLENRILALLEKKPEKGLEKLMDKYTGLVYTIVHNKLNVFCTKEDIEECVSSVFFEAFEKRSSIDLTKGTIKAFLAVLARRRAIDVFRKKEKEIGKVVSLEECEVKKQENLIDMEVTSPDNEMKNSVVESIKSLGEPDSEIFIRKYYFGQSTKIIAKILGLKENTVDKKVSRGLVKLRKILEGNTVLKDYEGNCKEDCIPKNIFMSETSVDLIMQERKDI